MANYECKTVSSKFKVTNEEAFKLELQEYEIEDVFHFYEGYYEIAQYDSLYRTTQDEDGDEIELDETWFYKFIQEHMAEGSKVFVSSIGNERLRYLSADCAIITKEKIEFRDLFYKIAKEFNNGISIF